MLGGEGDGLGGSSGTDRSGWLCCARNVRPKPMVPKSFRCGIGWREVGRIETNRAMRVLGERGDQNSEPVGVHPCVVPSYREPPLFICRFVTAGLGGPKGRG